MRTMKSLSRLAVLGAALLALAGSKGFAQEFKGSFDLPVAARWGRADLEPGRYKLAVTSDLEGHLVRLTDMNGKTLLVMAATRQDGRASEHSALTLKNIDGKYFIHTLEAGGIGQVLTFSVPKRQMSGLALRHGSDALVQVTGVGK